MATVEIKGTIQDAAGQPIDEVVTRLSPAPASVGAAEAKGGVGIASKPVEVLTGPTGEFVQTAVQGFRYRLEIPLIDYDREFVAPELAEITFDLLGLRPFVHTVTRGGVREDADDDGKPDPGGSEELKTFVTIEAQSLETVRERYDQIVVERAVAQVGPWVEVVTIDLLEGIEFYFHTDEVATDADLFYRARYKRGATESQESQIVSVESSSDEDLLISVEELKTLYLFGADLTDDKGNPFPDELFKHYIRAGADWLHKELDIPLTPVNIRDEMHDHFAKDYSQWGYFQLDQYPVIAVDRVWFQYPSQTSEAEITLDWVVLVDGGDSGVVQLTPGRGSIADVLLLPGHLLPMWSPGGRMPGIWHFDYRAGFETAHFPPDMKHAIGMWSAIGVLNIAGDLIAGAGIATKSVSVPGLNQNIGTTSSATNSGYGARIIEYQKELKEMLPNLRRFYGKVTRMVVP